MPGVACAKRESILSSSGCDDGVASPEPVGQRIFLNVDGRPVANILAQGKDTKAEFT